MRTCLFNKTQYIRCKAITNDLKDKTIDQVYNDYEVPVERQFTSEEREKSKSFSNVYDFRNLV